MGGGSWSRERMSRWGGGDSEVEMARWKKSQNNVGRVASSRKCIDLWGKNVLAKRARHYIY